jgi:hypothetical protein
MHPVIIQAAAADRSRDMQEHAAAWRRARETPAGPAPVAVHAHPRCRPRARSPCPRRGRCAIRAQPETVTRGDVSRGRSHAVPALIWRTRPCGSAPRRARRCGPGQARAVETDSCGAPRCTGQRPPVRQDTTLAASATSVRGGSEVLQAIALGCLSCMLGAPGRTLFMQSSRRSNVIQDSIVRAGEWT